MNAESQELLLVKILIGVAWLDGEIQPEERAYLSKVAQTHQLADPSIAALLSTPISQKECEDWIETYLGHSLFLANSNDSQDRLLEAISGMIYSDGDVAMAEAQVLMPFQSVETPTNRDSIPLISTLRQLYQNWVKKTLEY
jgi:uncharacterized tellurite resistance protein B-like protein